MDELCVQIDKVLIQFMDTLTDLYKEQTRLGESMKAGYINMSRARYNMGIRSVGIQQCDENKMNALKRVTFTDNEFIVSNADDLERDMKNIDLNGKSDQQGLRRRLPSKKDDSVSDTDSKKTEKIEEVDLPVDKNMGLFDPLKWFGVLVPQSLRQSQSEFKKSVDTAITVANLKAKLVTLQKEYTDLLQKKREMIS